jgi:hypothetical protein
MDMTMAELWERGDGAREPIFRTILHRIRRAGETGGETDFLQLDIDPGALSEAKFERLCVLATKIECTCLMHGARPPSWASDSRLFLAEPHMWDGFQVDELFSSPQPCLNHNVFVDVYSLSVL